ncbi:MAG: arginine decarboxylase [Anaerolineaceae bacterium]|nr:arginine decarboxylase [Anaerolineaceae bacterium]
MSDQTDHPIIGWEKETAVPSNHRFNRYLYAHNGHLHLEGLDLAQFFLDEAPQGFDKMMPSPLEIVYLPLIRQQIQKMNQVFADVIAELDYAGEFHYTYASKANAAEEVIRTTLGAGANHEMSSTVDVDIARIMIDRGLLTPDRMIVANGFKGPKSLYARNLLQLRLLHENLIPVIEDLDEISLFLSAGEPFNVGLRQKSYGPNETMAEMDEANSRFGLNTKDMWKAADYIAAAPNLTLKMYHYMVGSQLTDIPSFMSWLKPGIELFARLRQRYPSLSIFNFGGGMPVAMTLDFEFDYHEFARQLLTNLHEACQRYNVPVPDVMGEFGRYTTSEHGAHLFKIITVKDNGSKLPWYIIDGSIMSSFPDSWALSEHFIVLPLNHLDKPFQQVQLGGITCDSDDVYPPKPSHSPLYLPVETDDLYIGFFSIGAYQEMLGGVKGSKHCVLPEAYELVIDRDEDGRFQFQTIHGQTPEDVLNNLGYHV